MTAEKFDIIEILSSITPKVGNTVFIAIDGHGGSGKSTLAKLLAEHLDASLIHTDDFASWDHPLDWWPLLIEQVFMPIQNGAKTLNYPRSKWWDNHSPEPVVDEPVTPFMILEGVSSSRKEFNEFISYRIFVDTQKNVCLARGLERDSVTGKPREELERMWNAWREAEEEHFTNDETRARADLLIDGTKPFAEQFVL